VGREVVLLSGDHEMWGVFLVLGWKVVVNAQPMMKGMRPKIHGEICPKKHGTNCVSNCTMPTFQGVIAVILVRRVSNSGTNVTAKLSKEAMNFGVVVHFTVLVKEDVFS